MLATAVVLCEHGHAQERSRRGRILEIVAPEDLWIADRNFCSTDFLFGVDLDQPTRDGETEFRLLSNVPAKDSRAEVSADLSRRRWMIETTFQELAATLSGQINIFQYQDNSMFAF